MSKRTTTQNHDGKEYPAIRTNIDELQQVWETIQPGLPFYPWIEALQAAGVLTHLEIWGRHNDQFLFLFPLPDAE